MMILLLVMISLLTLKIPDDKRLNKIYNIENPFDYVDMDEFKDNSN